MKIEDSELTCPQCHTLITVEWEPEHAYGGGYYAAGCDGGCAYGGGNTEEAALDAWREDCATMEVKATTTEQQ